MTAKKVFITGGCGQCGLALVDLPYPKVFYDVQACPEALSEYDYIQGDLSDVDRLAAAMQGCQTVVHLAASSQVESTWQQVLENNILGTRNLLEASRSAGIERVIFASSNHVVGMVEIKHAPAIYELGYGLLVDEKTETCPDSDYGVSKQIGEDLGRYYALTGGPKFYALRIGTLTHEDTPFTLADRGVATGKWQRGSLEYQTKTKRNQALWLSKRDFVQLVTKLLHYSMQDFDIFNAISDNPRGWLDIRHAKNALGYLPQDNPEDWKRPE